MTKRPAASGPLRGESGLESKRLTGPSIQPPRPAAVAGAAYEALVTLFPSQKQSFDLQMQATLARIGGRADDQSVMRALAWGESVADQVLAWRATDGIGAVLPA